MNALPIEQWEGLRVLTVREPWATLIVTGYKDVENRSRYFGHRGPLLIHASGTLTLKYFREACMWISKNVPETYRPDFSDAFNSCCLNRGKIIGGCVVTACTPMATSPWYDRIGWGLQLSGAWKAVEPVRFKGQLSLGTYRKV